MRDEGNRPGAVKREPRRETRERPETKLDSRMD